MTKEKSEYLYIPFTDEVQCQDDNKRRYSTGKFGYPGGGLNVVSRYLRPSMGSCHDFCKYGEERALEIKARGPLPVPKKIMATQSEGQEVEKVVTSIEKVKKLAVNIKPPPVPHPWKHDDSVVKEEIPSSKKKETTSSSKQDSLPQDRVYISLERARDPIKRGVSSLANETNVLLKQASDPNKREVSSLVKKQAVSLNHVLTPIMEKDVFMDHAGYPVNNEASSLDKKEAISSRQDLMPLKEVDVSMNHASDPINKEVSSLTNEEAISSSQSRFASIKEASVYIKHANEPIDREVSSLAKKEAISSRQDLTPLKEVDVFMNHASNPINKEISASTCKDAISSDQVLTHTVEEEVIMEHASDSFNKKVEHANDSFNKEDLSSDNKEAISSSQGLSPPEEVNVYMKHATDVINEEVSSLAKKESTLSRQDLIPLKEVDVFMNHASNPINREISSLAYKEAKLSDQVLASTMAEEVILEHASDSFDKEKLSSTNKEAISSSQRLTPPKEVDVYTERAIDPISKEVSSLAKKEAMLSRQVATPLKEAGVLMKHASNPFSNEVSSLTNKGAISSSQDLKSIKEVDVYLNHANEPIKKGASSLAKKEANLPKQVIPLKKVGVSMKNPSDLKLKKTMKSNPSSVVMQRSSTTQADGKIRKSKPMENLSMNSLGVSTIKKKSEIKPRKEMRSSVRAERRVLVPPVVSLSITHSAKRLSRRKVEDSNNRKEVSHLGNQKAVRKLKNERSSNGVVPEKTLPTVDLISKRKALRPVKRSIGATDLSSSHENRSLKREIHGTPAAELPPSSLKRNLRPTQAEVHTAQTRQFTSSPKTEVLTSNQQGTHVTRSTFSSPALPSAESSVSSEHSKMESENGTSNSKKENNGVPRKGITMGSKTVSLKDKSDPGRKLTFKRGKVVELQQEDITPRRLKFKPRLPGGNQDIEGDASRVFALAKKEGDASSSRVLTVARKEVSVTKPESKKIVLKRRDLKEGRDSKILCNNVIEETVSKLVKTRTSKVKALVGAFESLITLQDTNLVTADAS